MRLDGTMQDFAEARSWQRRWCLDLPVVSKRPGAGDKVGQEGFRWRLSGIEENLLEARIGRYEPTALRITLKHLVAPSYERRVGHLEPSIDAGVFD